MATDNNILQPVSPDFNTFCRQNAEVFFNSTTPPPLSGKANVTFQFDQFGNVSACVATSGGTTIAHTDNLISGDGAGNGIDSGIVPSNVALINGTNTFTGVNTFDNDTTLSGNNTIGIANGSKNTFIASYRPAGGLLKIGFDNFNNNIQIDIDSIFQGGGALNLGTFVTSPIVFKPNNVEAGSFTSTGGFIVGTVADPGAGAISIQNNFTAGSIALTASTIATSATAGAATILPTAPLGYVEATITISGTPTVVKVPFYAV